MRPIKAILAGLLLASTPAAMLPLAPAAAQEVRVAAVVNGQAVTSADVDSRTRLILASFGQPPTAEAMARLRPQVLRSLIDERLRLQEIQRRKLLVSDRDVADQIGRIEQRQGLPAGGLAAQMRAASIDPRTWYDQLRAQIGWVRLIRQQLGTQGEITAAEIDEQIKALEAAVGTPEFLLSEVLLPIDDPAQEAEINRTAQQIIDRLRAGAPIAPIAVQFSAGVSAQEGGDLGWVRAEQLDSEVAAVVQAMPPGAITNPIRTVGGVAIIQKRGQREIGNQPVTVLEIRQAFVPFEGALDPANLSPQQRQAVETANRIAAGTRSCAAMEEASRSIRSPRPPNPGNITLEGLPPALRARLAALAVNQTTVIGATDGVAALIVCSKRTDNIGAPSRESVAQSLLRDRQDLLSRQVLRDLRRRAQIEVRA
jgi:peptidyl-prolyl cis-trans isomerase SurA